MNKECLNTDITIENWKETGIQSTVFDEKDYRKKNQELVTERDKYRQINWKLSEEKKSELLKQESKNENLLWNNTVRKSYADAFLNLVWDDKELSKVIESLKNGSQMELSVKDIENIYNKLNEIKHKSCTDFIDQELSAWNNKDEARNKFHNLVKFCMDPKAIKKYKAFNCSWASLMMASIIESLWWTAYITRVYHHVVCITELWNRPYMIDANNTRIEDITDKVDVEDTEYKYIKRFNAKEPLFKEYTEWYVFGSLQEAEKIINGSNYKTMDEDEYKEVRKKITGLVTGEKINSYPKDYPKLEEFPEFDQKIYNIYKEQWKAKNIFWKMKLKVQEWLTRVKRQFSRK